MRVAPLLAGLAALTTVAAGSPAPEPLATVSHQVVRSFDGEPLYTTLFLPAGASPSSPVPLVMRGHGWGQHGERDLDEASTTTRALLAAGYAVFTWDERGFGYSGGQAHVLKPEQEGRDASALIDHIATDPAVAPNIACDTNRLADSTCPDPVLGMSGNSYGGGIQLLTAAFDAQYSKTTAGGKPRINAITPTITWNDLRYSLYDNEVINFGWSAGLYAIGTESSQADGLDPRNPAGPQTGGLDPRLDQSFAEGTATNHLSPESTDFLADSSFAVYGQTHPISVPSLFVQGSVDTLFDLTEGARNFQTVRKAAPAKMIAFCGGHVGCPADYADAGDVPHVDHAVVTWFDKYLKHQDVSTGSPVEYRTNEGIWRSTDNFPPSDARWLPASGAGSVISTPAETTAVPGGADLTEPALITAQPNPPGDPHAFAFEVAHAANSTLELVGIPTAQLTVSGSGPEAHLFLKLIDREAGTVVNLQEAAKSVTGLSEAPQQFSLPMPGIAYTLPRGHHLDLQVSTSSVMDAVSRTPAQVAVSVDLRVPRR